IYNQENRWRGNTRERITRPNAIECCKLELMTIHLRPELEELIKQDIQRGAYQTVDEYVEHAVFMLHEQEAWLAEHQSEITAKIQAGYDAAQRGELIDSDQVRSALEDRKRLWLAGKRQR
ncbi:MAG TPA: hypothetical protein VH724_06675, partial [Candidatus Angelobacter sp.]|nr:hypothetical protein [Candidatus Angelobacter sp.]